MKLYSSLDEALSDVRFEKGVARLCVLGFVGDFSLRGHKFMEKIEPFIGWLRLCLENLNQPIDVVYDSCSVLGELTMNAYRWVESPEDFCITSAYVGKKGVVMGTKQNNHFLSPEQIALLLNGERVPSTRDTLVGGGGTDLIRDFAEGILIIEKEKSIYVAKYFQ